MCQLQKGLVHICITTKILLLCYYRSETLQCLFIRAIPIIGTVSVVFLSLWSFLQRHGHQAGLLCGFHLHEIIYLNTVLYVFLFSTQGWVSCFIISILYSIIQPHKNLYSTSGHLGIHLQHIVFVLLLATKVQRKPLKCLLRAIIYQFITDLGFSSTKSFK